MWYPWSGVVLDLSIPDLCRISYFNVTRPCADPLESFVGGGPLMTFFLKILIDDGSEVSNTTICGPSSAI